MNFNIKQFLNFIGLFFECLLVILFDSLKEESYLILLLNYILQILQD